MSMRIRRKWAVQLLGGAALFHTAVSFGADTGRVSYISYFGGVGTAVNAMASDTQGSVYLGGVTFSTDLPVTAGSYHPQPYPDCSSGRCQHGFVAKVSASGGLVWSTYLGGNGSLGAVRSGGGGEEGFKTAAINIEWDQKHYSSPAEGSPVPSEIPSEHFSLNFAKVEYSYQQQGADGKAQGGPILAGWDVK